MSRMFEDYSPLQLLNILVSAVVNENWDLLDAIEEELGLNKVPYPYENID